MIPDYLIIETVFKSIAAAHELDWRNAVHGRKSMFVFIFCDLFSRDFTEYLLNIHFNTVQFHLRDHKRKMRDDIRYKIAYTYARNDIEQKLEALKTYNYFAY